MNIKRRKTLRLQQAALLVMGFDENKTFKQNYDDISPKNDEYNKLMENLSEAKNIYEVLLDDAKLCCGRFRSDTHTVLRVALTAKSASSMGEEQFFDPKISTFTISSLAQWFYKEYNDIEKSKIIYPQFTPNIEIITPGELKRLKDENEALKRELEQKTTSELIKDDTKNILDTEPALTNYLPVKGKTMEALSLAMQDFPIRFKDHKLRNHTKETVKKWLSSSYNHKQREQFVFADILMQHFEVKESE